MSFVNAFPGVDEVIEPPICQRGLGMRVQQAKRNDTKPILGSCKESANVIHHYLQVWQARGLPGAAWNGYDPRRLAALIVEGI